MMSFSGKYLYLGSGVGQEVEPRHRGRGTAAD
jgi:hypothetical protein